MAGTRKERSRKFIQVIGWNVLAQPLLVGPRKYFLGIGLVNALRGSNSGFKAFPSPFLNKDVSAHAQERYAARHFSCIRLSSVIVAKRD